MCYLFSKDDDFAPKLSESKDLAGSVVGRKPGGSGGAAAATTSSASGRRSLKLDDSDSVGAFASNPKAAAYAIASQIINYSPPSTPNTNANALDRGRRNDDAHARPSTSVYKGKPSEHVSTSKGKPSDHVGTSKGNKSFRTWGYGQSIMIDAMIMAAEHFGEAFMTIEHAGAANRLFGAVFTLIVILFTKTGSGRT